MKMRASLAWLALVIFAASAAQAQTTVTNSNNGSTNTVPVYTGTATLGNSPISVSGGNVGIGATTPGGQLDLHTTPVATLQGGPNVRLMRDYSGSGYGSALYDGYTTTSYQDVLVFGVSNNGNPAAAGNEKMVIEANGNVGIGTTNPIVRLQIGPTWMSAPAVSGVKLLIEDYDGDSGLELGAFGDATKQFTIVNSNSYVTESSAGGYSINSGKNYPGDISLNANGAAGVGKVVLQPSGGNVGIGTTAPGYKLDVRGGQINSSGGYCINGSNCISSWPTGGANTWNSTQTFSASTNFPGNGIWNASGNAGIGTTQPTNSLSFLDMSSGTGTQGISWSISSPLAYGIYRTAGSWSAPNYQQLEMANATGIIIDGGTA